MKRTPRKRIIPARLLSPGMLILPRAFLSEIMENSLRAVFTVHTDGTAEVQLVESSGDEVLDEIVLSLVRHWRFAPATIDGQPVESYLRLRVELETESNLYQ